MNNVEKMIKLLDEKEYSELRVLLVGELLSKEDKSRYNLFSAVSKYIKKNVGNRNLDKVYYYNGKQFIINGYTAFIFNDYIKELDELPNERENSINIFNVIDTGEHNYISLSEEDEIIFKNLNKYASYYKTQPIYDKSKSNMILVPFNNKMFNIDILKDAYNIIGKDTDKLVISNHYDCLLDDKGNKVITSPTQIKNENITGIILPVRYNEEEYKKCCQIRDNFIKELNK